MHGSTEFLIIGLFWLAMFAAGIVVVFTSDVAFGIGVAGVSASLGYASLRQWWSPPDSGTGGSLRGGPGPPRPPTRRPPGRGGAPAGARPRPSLPGLSPGLPERWTVLTEPGRFGPESRGANVEGGCSSGWS